MSAPEVVVPESVTGVEECKRIGCTKPSKSVKRGRFRSGAGVNDHLKGTGIHRNGLDHLVAVEVLRVNDGCHCSAFVALLSLGVQLPWIRVDKLVLLLSP